MRYSLCNVSRLLQVTATASMLNLSSKHYEGAKNLMKSFFVASAEPGRRQLSEIGGAKLKT